MLIDTSIDFSILHSAAHKMELFVQQNGNSSEYFS